MKITRYVVLLSLIALLLTSCAGLPPVFPTGETSTQGAEGTGAAVAATEPTAQPPAEATAAPEQPTAAPATVVSETVVVTATVAAPAATIAATEVVTGTAAVETPATPTADQVMGANPLVGVVWEWAALLKTKPAVQSVVPDPSAYTVTFSDDGTVAIKADCNNASGTYTLDNDALTIQIGPVTRAACPPGSLSDLMLASLSKVGSYLIDGGDLILRTADTGTSMLFRNGGPPAVPAAPAAPAATEAPAGAAAPAPAQTPTARCDCACAGRNGMAVGAIRGRRHGQGQHGYHEPGAVHGHLHGRRVRGDEGGLQPGRGDLHGGRRADDDQRGAGHPGRVRPGFASGDVPYRPDQRGDLFDREWEAEPGPDGGRGTDDFRGRKIV